MSAVRRSGRAGDIRDEAPCNAGREQGVTPRHNSYRVDQVSWLGVLDQEAAGSGADGLVDELVRLERRQDDDLHAGQIVLGGDPPRGLKPVHVRHPDVHQHDVGSLPPGQRDGLRAVGGLTHNFHVVGAIDEHPETGPDQRLIISEQDSNHERDPVPACCDSTSAGWDAGRSAGRTATTR